MPKSYTHSNNRVFVRVFPQPKSPLPTQNYEFGEFSTVSTPPTTITIFIYINNNALAKGIVMKIYCNKSELYRALNNAIQAVPSRSTSKILEGVLIETKEDEMIITGTDTFMVVESKLSAKCDGIADFVAPAALFANIIGKLPAEDVMMEYDSVKRVLSIQSGRYRSEVICFDSAEFPKVQMKEPQKSITLNKESVRKLIRKTAFSASADEINGILTGVLCEIGDGNFRMVAVDAFRMAIYNEPLEDSIDAFKVVIPAKQLNKMSKIISDDGDETIRMELVDEKAVFSFDGTKVTLNTMNGRYIDYKRIIKVDSTTEVRIQKDELIRSIDRASILTQKENNNMIKFDIQDDLLEISALDNQGNMNEKIEIIQKGEDLKIGFNSRYMIDILRSIDDEEVVLYMRDNVSPCIFRPLQGERYLYLALPIRIN